MERVSRVVRERARARIDARDAIRARFLVTADVAVGVAMEDDGGMQRFRGVGTRRRRADADADADVDDEKRTRYDRLRSRIRRRTSDDG